MRKVLLFVALICCMMPMMAQKNNDKTLKEMREMKKKVELLNSRANTYTEKLDSVIVTNNYRELISYDERFNCKKVNTYNYDSIGSWVLNIVYDYEFDSQDRLISQIYTKYGDEPYCYRINIEYNDQGLVTTEIIWEDIEGAWVGVYKFTSEYDAQGNLSKETVCLPDENNEWFVYYYYEYNYENADETQILCYLWNELTQNYELEEREVYHYENQLCTLYEVNLWDSADSVWILWYKYEYMYFDNGNLKEETYFESDVWGSEPEPISKSQYEYDSHNNNTLTRHYMYSEDWVPKRQDEMEYDLNVPKANVAGLSFRYGGLYNDKMLNKRGIYPEDIKEYVFYYSNAGTGVAESAESRMSVWPNPVSETLNLKGDMTQVKIFSMDGKQVMNIQHSFESINVSNLANGCYLLKATFTNGSMAVQKFVKE